jgi:hypothetical protein
VKSIHGLVEKCVNSLFFWFLIEIIWSKIFSIEFTVVFDVYC